MIHVMRTGLQRDCIRGCCIPAPQSIPRAMTLRMRTGIVPVGGGNLFPAALLCRIATRQPPIAVDVRHFDCGADIAENETPSGDRMSRRHHRRVWASHIQSRLEKRQDPRLVLTGPSVREQKGVAHDARLEPESELGPFAETITAFVRRPLLPLLRPLMRLLSLYGDDTAMYSLRTHPAEDQEDDAKRGDHGRHLCRNQESKQ